MSPAPPSRRTLLQAALAATLPVAARAQAARPGGTIRVAQITPAGAIDPVSVSDPGGLVLLQQTGEFLAFNAPDLSLQPMLALSWTPNEHADVWTFALRPGVRFHDGRPMTAADVVASMDRLADPTHASNALSVFRGVLSPGGARAQGELEVAFHLERPVGHFPYYVSSDNYNAIILPADYRGDFEAHFNGTGPFRLERYVPRQGASFVRNDAYWGAPALPDRTEFAFYADQQSQVLALQGGAADMMQQLVVQGGQALLDDPDVTLLRLRSAAHRQIHMRCDAGPFADRRVRQALALTLDRPAWVQGLFHGYAGLGNDSPFAPVYPSTDPGVPQRAKDLPRARALLAEAGHPDGFAATLTTEQYQELPVTAVLLRNAAASIGIRLTLKVEPQAAYYGAGVPGQSDWLDSELGITDYGHRGTPDVVLAACLGSAGAWNAARFRNPEYDRLVEAYVAGTDAAAQRATAGRIEALLLDETPVIFPAFYDFLVPVSARLHGVRATAIAQIFLDRASLG